MVDRNGRMRGRFRGSRKLDEIGDLSRALERLTRRLDAHVNFIESFASDVSHEFKNPLASIRSATELLAEVDDVKQRARFREMIEQDVSRMEQLLSELREITLIDVRLPSEQREQIELTALLNRLCDRYRISEKNRVHLLLKTDDRPAIVEAGESRLLQVFTNILDNAVSFAPDGSSVLISVGADHGQVRVRIEDEGLGFPDAHRSRIFDRFFSYRPQHAERSHSGLGLAIVKTIVEGYGGSITARNRSAGGAMIELRLPSVG
jgi:two-component system sensor histidine kinase ChvG